MPKKKPQKNKAVNAWREGSTEAQKGHYLTQLEDSENFLEKAAAELSSDGEQELTKSNKLERAF